MNECGGLSQVDNAKSKASAAGGAVTDAVKGVVGSAKDATERASAAVRAKVRGSTLPLMHGKHAS